MAIDVAAVQSALRAQQMDGWLLYDFHGCNPIAARLAGTLGTGKMATRRWFYLIPAQGQPRGLVHAIERHNLDALPGEKTVYAGREQLAEGLRSLVNGSHRLAMEYSPDCNIPYLSRVDAGTVEWVREMGVDVVSSGDLVQQFEAVWDDAAHATHRAASDALYRVKDRAFATVAQRLRDGIQTSDFEIQQLMVGWFVEEGLEADAPAVVAVQEDAGNPHFMPSPQRPRRIQSDMLVLLDLWGKQSTPGAVYADITWVGFTGPKPPQAVVSAFSTICAARDAAVQLVQESAAQGRTLMGWEVDRAARTVIQDAGYGAHILHRTGHSLGQEVHGNGVHMDDYETRDDRRLLPGTGFTIEPGLYFESFGVRTEINMVVGQHEATVTGDRQQEIVPLV